MLIFVVGRLYENVESAKRRKNPILRFRIIGKYTKNIFSYVADSTFSYNRQIAKKDRFLLLCYIIGRLYAFQFTCTKKYFCVFCRLYENVESAKRKKKIFFWFTDSTKM